MEKKEGTSELFNLFEQYFYIKKMKLFWGKICSVPLTLNYILILLVQHEIVLEDSAIELTADPQATHLATILSKNEKYCDKICNLGYKCNRFRLKFDVK